MGLGLCMELGLVVGQRIVMGLWMQMRLLMGLGR